jgi:hypothetical protein
MARRVEVRTESGPILVEQALTMARELELASDAAPDGQVQTVADRAVRELTRRALVGEDPPPCRAGQENGPPGRACPCGGCRRDRGKAPKISVTAAGRVTLTRHTLRCPGCGLAAYPDDDRLGLAAFLSPTATRHSRARDRATPPAPRNWGLS